MLCNLPAVLKDRVTNAFRRGAFRLRRCWTGLSPRLCRSPMPFGGEPFGSTLRGYLESMREAGHQCLSAGSLSAPEEQAPAVAPEVAGHQCLSAGSLSAPEGVVLEIVSKVICHQCLSAGSLSAPKCLMCGSEDCGVCHQCLSAGSLSAPKYEQCQCGQ